MTHIIGALAKVEVWNPVLMRSEYFDCRISEIVGSTDREYRVNVVLLDSGKEIHQCAPECVIKI